MAIALVDLEGLAQACVAGDLAAFASEPRLGWTLTEPARVALLRAIEHTNHHGGYAYGRSAFTLAAAIGLISEAATNEVGIAIVEQHRKIGGKEIAIAFRHTESGAVHFGVRYASNLPMTPGHVWPELRPWYKVVERNRARLERWIAGEGIVAVPLTGSPSPEPSGEGDELLAAVIADPDAVDRRLVYADWLVGQGDARGELIQLCERRRSLAERDPELDARIAQLEAEYGVRIAGEVAQLAKRYTLERGFVVRVVMSGPRWAKHGERLLQQHPIWKLELDPVNAKALAQVAAAPGTRLLDTLRIGQSIARPSPIGFEALCGTTGFARLRELEIWTWRCAGDPEGAFASWQAPALTRVMLYEVDRSAAIVAGLGRNPRVGLTSLTVSQRQADDAWAEGWFEPEGFATLRCLGLTLGPGMPARLLAGATLPRLEVLNIDGYDGLVDVDTLRFPTLRRLSVDAIADPDVALPELLARHPRLRGLELRRWLEPSQAEAILTGALALAEDHPLVAFKCPSAGADPALVAAVRERFPVDFYAAAD